MIMRARIEDGDILKEIHAGEPPWENFEIYLKSIRNSGGDVFLYRDKGEIELLPLNGKAHIHGVREGYRRKGIGSKLLTFAEEWAKKRDLKGLSVIPEDKNAMKFYEKNGFEFRDWQVKGMKDVEGCNIEVESHYDNPSTFPNLFSRLYFRSFPSESPQKAPRFGFGDFVILDERLENFRERRL